MSRALNKSYQDSRLFPLSQVVSDETQSHNYGASFLVGFSMPGGPSGSSQGNPGAFSAAWTFESPADGPFAISTTAVSTRILGRRTARFSPFLIPYRVPHGFNPKILVLTPIARCSAGERTPLPPHGWRCGLCQGSGGGRRRRRRLCVPRAVDN